MKLAALLSFLSAVVAAQEFPRYSFAVAGGFTTPVRSTSERVDRGYNLGVGGGVNFLESFGVMFDFNYNALNLPGTESPARLWSLTANPILHLTPRRPVDVYLIGGGGLYRSNAGFGGNALYRPGVNGGLGLAFGKWWHAKIFAEARYHQMFVDGRDISVIPVSFGFRW